MYHDFAKTEGVVENVGKNRETMTVQFSILCILGSFITWQYRVDKRLRQLSERLPFWESYFQTKGQLEGSRIEWFVPQKGSENWAPALKMLWKTYEEKENETKKS